MFWIIFCRPKCEMWILEITHSLTYTQWLFLHPENWCVLVILSIYFFTLYTAVSFFEKLCCIFLCLFIFHIWTIFSIIYDCAFRKQLFCRNYTSVDEIVIRLNSQPLSLKMVVFHLLKICHALTGISKKLLFKGQ